MGFDSLFSKREHKMERMGKTALSQAQSDLVETVLQDEKIADKFDKTIFTKLIDKVKVKNRYEIIFVFMNGGEIKAENE